MKKIILLLTAFVSSQAFGQIPKPLTIKQLTDSIETIVKQQHIPGLMLGIATKDSILFSGGFGYADLQTKRLVNGQTLFRMGSITKSIVAIGIMQLVENGKLNLNDELKKIAPEVPFTNDWEATHAVKIINLLEHTTGFDDFKLNKMYTLDRKDYNTKELMILQKNSMVSRWRPDERHSYSNVNYVVLGYIIKKITGKEYNKYLTENVLQPLGMIHSNFNLYSRYPAYDVKEYGFSENKITEIPSVTCLIGPAGTLWSCSDDMVKFLQLFLHNGKPILSESSLNEMEKPHSSIAAKAGLKSGYAIGNQDYGSFRGHEGSMGVCDSKYLYNRSLGVGFVISSNGNGLGSIEKLVTDFLSKNKVQNKIHTIPLDKKAIDQYQGYYQLESPRFDILSFTDKLLMLKVDVINDTLCINILGKKRKMQQTAPLIFANKGASIPNAVFTINNEGKRVLIFNGRYCEQTPAVWAITKRIVIVLLIILTILSFIPALSAAIAAVLKKINWVEVPIMALPMLSTICLIWALVSFLKVLGSTYLLYKFVDINSISLGIYLGTLLFGLLSTVNLIVLLSKFKKMQNRYIAWYMLFTAISLFGLTLILIFNGWIGLRTWAM